MDNALLEFREYLLRNGAHNRIAIQSSNIYPNMGKYDFELLADWIRAQDHTMVLK